MADFNIRTDAVDVEQIMRQIRARIESKRGVDYTEQQIQELANVKLERFLNPKGVRSDLVDQFKRVRDVKLEPFQIEPELERVSMRRCCTEPIEASSGHTEAAEPDPEALLQSEHADSRGEQADPR